MGLVKEKSYYQLDRITGKYRKVTPPPTEMGVKKYYKPSQYQRRKQKENEAN